MQFTTDNAAFDGSIPATETARILHEVAKLIEDGAFDRVVHDINGNKIGRFSLNNE
jgi:hypothetical protein